MGRKLLINGNIITVDRTRPRAEAMAIEDGMFIRVGTNREILALHDETTEIIDLQGQTVTPGFNDSHMHLLNVGIALETVNLSSARARKDITRLGKEFLDSNFSVDWLLGRGWNHTKFSDKALPNRHDLDEISTEIPILFSRVCGHIFVANSKALELAGITDNVKQPQGGHIDLDENGEPTGILRERAVGLVSCLVPERTLADYKRLIHKGASLAVSLGLTSVQTDDMGSTTSMTTKLQAYKEQFEAGQLPLRVNLQIRLSVPEQIEEYLKIREDFLFPPHTVDYGLIKLMTDGSLGGRTAAMLEPYSDDPSTCGVAVMTQEQINKMLLLAHRYGLQVGGHAIGDRAMTMLLNGFRQMLKDKPVSDARPRIIHAQLTNQDILQQMKELGVVCDIQPVFVGTDLHFVEERIGTERASTSYAWKTMREMGIPTAGGSDSPVESCNPIWGIYHAVTRKDLSGYPNQGWRPEEKLTVEEALELFTMGSAFATFDEKVKGSIVKGKLADFVVLSDDITEINSDNIKDVTVIETYAGGKCVYRAVRG